MEFNPLHRRTDGGVVIVRAGQLVMEVEPGLWADALWDNCDALTKAGNALAAHCLLGGFVLHHNLMARRAYEAALREARLRERTPSCRPAVAESAENVVPGPWPEGAA